MESLLLQQEDLMERLDNAFSNYRKTPKDRLTTTYVEARLENLEKMWNKYNENHYIIIGGVKKADRSKLAYFEDKNYYGYEAMYTDYKIKMKDELQKANQRSYTPAEDRSTTTNQATCEVKLPQIQLPKFSGGYEDWQEFYDMFTSVIHANTNLSPVQKLHYLKGSLSGEAENLLKNLPTTDTNYEEAWSQLKRRFTNKRYNCNEILKRLMAQKTLINESASAIKALLDTTSACLKSLNNIGIETQSWDAIIIHITVSKLDIESRKLWEMQLSQSTDDSIPQWEQFYTFLETRFRTLEMLEGTKSVGKGSNISSKPFIKQKSFHTTTTTQEEKRVHTCVMCSGQHYIYQCKQFGKQTPNERLDYVQSKRLCFNCLAPTHTVKSCHQVSCCRRCGRRHHTLLHLERTQGLPVEEATKEESASSSDTERRVVAHLATKSLNHESDVLLATAMVNISSTNGYSRMIRALIDQGSEASFITEATVQSLGLKRIHINGLVSGVGNGGTRTKYMVSFNISSIHNQEFIIHVNAYVLSTLTSILPAKGASLSDWSDIENLPLADPKYGSPGKIDIILGVDVHSEIILDGLIKHPLRSGPIAQNTQLGWVLSGHTKLPTSSTNRRNINLHVTIREDQILKQFWEIEREPDSKDILKKFTKEEIRCEEIYEETTIRTKEGCYEVKLPFKEGDPKCLYGKSKEIALRRYKTLENKLLKNRELYEDYKKVMKMYIEEKFMEKIDDKKGLTDQMVVYLPHHAVVRDDKETTKVRIVFDASCKGVNNVSLNDCFLVGPKLQQDLRHILMRWRRHPICMIADLVKMYLQVIVNKSDTDFQRIYWRPNTHQPIEHYRLLRLIFGTSCAPYLAVKSLQQLAKDEFNEYPVAAKITLEDYYMDDLLTGAETEEEAIEIYEQMNKLINAGGFKLQKWCSNSNKLLEYINKESQRSKDVLTFKINNTIKVLGISWNKNTDNFEYILHLPEMSRSQTKREILSDIARIYDPMGWIAPVVITAKIFIQKLWKAKLSWDESLPPELQQEWSRFRNGLNDIPLVVIPRWLQTRREDSVELHVFADASSSAYAAAVYLKTKKINNEIIVNLITAKTKVAPVEKEISIPRMELCAGLTAAKLIFEVSQILQIPQDRLFAWTDSTILLAWLRGEPSRWTTFVSNRVSEILTILNKDQWYHVRSEENPADCASRGIPVVELANHSLWWHGPHWLSQNTEYELNHDFTTKEEQRAIRTLTALVQRQNEDFIWNKFSSLSKVLRVLAYCRKFLNLKLPKQDRKQLNRVVCAEEMETVLQNCIKQVQLFYFQEEIKQLKQSKDLSKKSQLRTLCPVFDENGILRVSGRISQAQVNFDKRHPIIMPYESHFTRLLVSNAHLKTLHGGPQVMLNFLRTRFWIVKARELVKKCYRDCFTCLRYAKQNNNQLMGQLPLVRLKPSKPFKNTGVDFTGHINLRFSPGRGSKSYKGYICLFICMTTRAIHLEAVSDLSSQGFIAAFRRFISRRGHCENLYSDNGTNFVGANKELQQLFSKAEKELSHEIVQLLANEGTMWHFIPPHSPNFGGLWEAGVRSTKTHLKRVIGDATLTYEELSTVLAQIEACLNSRPLSYLSNNPDDPLPLTPGHFLVGEPLLVFPDGCKNMTDVQVSGLKRWRLVQKIVNDYWHKWSDEYLVTLNQRTKWNTKREEPELDDVVIIRDDNLPPAKWLLGKIIGKHPGKDNVTRVVTIKTKNGTCKRPCNKLCFLHKSSNN